METQKVKFAYKCSSDIRGYSTGHISGSPILKDRQVIKVVSEQLLDGHFNKVYFLKIVSADYDKYVAEKIEGNSRTVFCGYSYESNLVFFD